MKTIDWGQGFYEDTAAQLEPAADEVAKLLNPTHGAEVLDVGCGTGNAALALSRCGAKVTGLDPAPRLVEVATARARERGLDATFVVGRGEELPFEADHFDAVVSVFALIFVPDAQRAIDEAMRVLRSGGTLLMTTWKPDGPVAGVGKILVENALEVAASSQAETQSSQAAPSTPPAPPAWDDPAFIEAMLCARGELSVEERTISFSDASPERWFEQHEKRHPAWSALIEAIGPTSPRWRDARDECLRILRDGNLDPEGFRVESTYYVVRLRKPD